MDLISIIIPVYKVESTINICIESVVNQTYKKIEIILIDDGSPDQCPYICDKWKAIDSRIKVVHKQNEGLSAARNCGLEIAQGKFISFVDSDDYVSPLFIECLYNTLKNNNADIAIVDYKKVNDLKQNFRKVTKDELCGIPISSIKGAITELFSEDSFSNSMVNKLYNRTLFDNIKFPVGRKMEDLGTTYKLFLKSEKIAYNPLPLYHYYQRENSIVHTQDKCFAEDLFILSLERYTTLKKIYPDLKENAGFMFNVLLNTFPYLNEDTISFLLINNLFKETYRNSKNIISIKAKIKYIIFIFNKKLYIKIFKKY